MKAIVVFAALICITLNVQAQNVGAGSGYYVHAECGAMSPPA